MGKTIFDKDDHTVTTFEESADSFTLTRHQDTQPILEQNAIERNANANAKSDGPFGRKVASIPLVVWQEWMKQTNGDIQKDPLLLAKYLNDHANKKLRTHNSRV